MPMASAHRQELLLLWLLPLGVLGRGQGRVQCCPGVVHSKAVVKVQDRKIKILGMTSK